MAMAGPAEDATDSKRIRVRFSTSSRNISIAFDSVFESVAGAEIGADTPTRSAPSTWSQTRARAKKQQQPTLWTHVSRASAAGWPGSRTYRRACSATQWFEPHLSGIIGIALWRYV